MPMHYVEMQAQSVLNRLPHDNFVFRWSINLYRGCRHACPFCYARYTHWFLGYEQPRDFQEIIEVKTNAPQVLAMELASPNWARELVSLGAATDNYQPAEKQYRLTRETLKLLAQHRTPAIFSTKSDLVLRDIDVLQDLTKRAYVGVAMTITTMDHKSGLFLEPHAVPVARRMRALERLKAAGITTGVHLMPLMPGISDTDEAMEAICRAAKEVGVELSLNTGLRLEEVLSLTLEQIRSHDPEPTAEADITVKGGWQETFF